MDRSGIEASSPREYGPFSCNGYLKVRFVTHCRHAVKSGPTTMSVGSYCWLQTEKHDGRMCNDTIAEFANNICAISR
jgi:hypothetical protein